MFSDIVNKFYKTASISVKNVCMQTKYDYIDDLGVTL